MRLTDNGSGKAIRMPAVDRGQLACGLHRELTGANMALIITILQLLGLAVVIVVVLGFAARHTLNKRTGRGADRPSKFSDDAPANPEKPGAPADRHQ
jgi:hypothetical protein